MNNAHDKPDSERKIADNWLYTDKKFIKFLVGDLFTSGLHTWWLVGLFSMVSVAFIFLVFFASLIDSNYLFVASETFRDKRQQALGSHGYSRHQFPINYADLARLATLADARQMLGNPYISAPRRP